MESDEHKKLQALTALGWTQAVYWEFNPNTSALNWNEGVFNGGPTSETIKPGCEEKRIQRELVLQDSKCSDYFNPNILKAQLLCTASLNLSDSEWFYIVSTAFSFPLGVGTLGTVLQSGKWQWLCGIQNLDASTCARIRLAKSGGIKTLLVIPVQNGVLELASNQEIPENPSMVQYAEALFHDQPALHYGAFLNQGNCNDPSGLLESLTSSNLTYSQAAGSTSVVQGDSVSMNPQGLLGYQMDEPQLPSQVVLAKLLAEQENHMATKANIDSNLQSIIAHLELPLNKREISSAKFGVGGNGGFPQVYDGLPGDFQHSKRLKLFPNGPGTLAPNSKLVENPLFRMSPGEEIQSVHPKNEILSPDVVDLDAGLNELDSGREQSRGGRNGWGARVKPAPHSVTGTKSTGEPKAGTGNPPFDPTGHIMTERRRREKLNSQFLALRAVVPKVSKMDKASVLSDAVSYINDLKQRITDLESQVERNARSSSCKSSVVDGSRSASIEDKTFDNFGDRNEPQSEIEVQMVDTSVIITIRSPKRPRLQSDILVVLNDLELDINHATISTFGNLSLCIYNTKVSTTKLTSNEIMNNLRCMLDRSQADKLMEKCSPSPMSHA